jgi:hypothetical protein
MDEDSNNDLKPNLDIGDLGQSEKEKSLNFEEPRCSPAFYYGDNGVSSSNKINTNTKDIQDGVKKKIMNRQISLIKHSKDN